MNASGGELVLATTDLEVSARLRLPVQVQEEGVTLIPARLLADMVKSFDQAPVVIEAEGGQARIVCSNYEGTVRCLPAEDFPALADPGGTRVSVEGANTARANSPTGMTGSYARPSSQMLQSSRLASTPSRVAASSIPSTEYLPT